MTNKVSRYLTALCTMLLASVFLVLPAPASQAAGDPSTWAGSCNVPGLSMAPVISADKDNSGQPVKIRPNERGTYVPVVYVHGWQSTSIHDESGKGAFSAKPNILTSRIGTAAPTRTLIGNIQDLGGTAAFTFDYAKYASRWVTDENIGPALAKALNCLYEHSGEKAIVVAHSMGGLATREALMMGGPALASRVSQVITFGTPNTGSLISAIAEGVFDAAALSHGAAFMFRMWLAYCGKLKSEDQNNSNLLCASFVPGFLTSFESEAAVALRAGSKELKALAPWPAGLPVHALAGDTEFTLTGQGFFFQKTSEVAGVGDIVVNLSSAISGGTTKKEAPCAYELSALSSTVNDLKVNWLGIATKNEVSRPLANLLLEPIPCFHNNLMKNADLALDELGFIADDLAGRVPPTQVVTVRPWSDGSAKNPDRTIDGLNIVPAMQCSISDYVIRSDAYACHGGGFGADPCFRDPSTKSTYLCMPDRERVLVKNAQEAGANTFNYSPDESNPFMAILADGTVCRRFQGAGPFGIPGYPYWIGTCGGPHGGVWRERNPDPVTRDDSVRGIYDRTDSGVWHIAIEENSSPGTATLYPAQAIYR